jgi:aryl-alcohol dehydrogenase-like predicted oxidoreductase
LPAWATEAGYTSWSALLLAFVIAQPAVTCVIPATSQAAHVQENLQAALTPLPDDALLARIAAEVR